MKQFYLVFSFFTLAASQAQTCCDSIFFWKTGVLLEKRSIKLADLDSLTFKRPASGTINICSQVWASKNLNVTTYQDGTPIPQVTDPTAWASLTTGAWCYYNNDPANDAIYGKLYNYYAIIGKHDNDPNTTNKMLAPSGWRIPTDNYDWPPLTTCLGGESVAGGKMKEMGTAHWNSPNQNATNTSGFKGLPGGVRYDNGAFLGIGNEGYWWSSSQKNSLMAYARGLNYNNGSIYKSYFDMRLGFSVRCIKG